MMCNNICLLVVLQQQVYIVIFVLLGRSAGSSATLPVPAAVWLYMKELAWRLISFIVTKWITPVKAALAESWQMVYRYPREVWVHPCLLYLLNSSSSEKLFVLLLQTNSHVIVPDSHLYVKWRLLVQFCCVTYKEVCSMDSGQRRFLLSVQSVKTLVHGNILAKTGGRYTIKLESFLGLTNCTVSTHCDNIHGMN